MNLTGILLLEESNNSTNTDKITAIRAILNNDLVLLVANNKDVSQSVITSEETLLKVFNDIQNTKNTFQKFTSSMCDWIYTQLENTRKDSLQIKTKLGDIITCDLKWQQGQGNNYYFYSSYFDREISINNVEEFLL